MKFIALILAGLAALSLTAPAHAAEGQCSELLDHNLRPLGESQPVNLCESYKGQVVLIVNTASRCAYTPQYEELEALYRRYSDRGLVVLGFPSNDFGNQEPGTEQEIKSFCRLTYDVGFPMFEKTRAAEGSADPIYERLAKASGTYPRWNFYKYLLDRNGELVDVFPSQIGPEHPRIVDLIERLL